MFFLRLSTRNKDIYCNIGQSDSDAVEDLKRRVKNRCSLDQLSGWENRFVLIGQRRNDVAIECVGGRLKRHLNRSEGKSL